MKGLSIIALILTFCASMTFAQTAAQADGLFANQEYELAYKAYGTLLKRSPKNALYLYRYARCAQELQQDSIAIQYFLQAGNKYDLRHFYLGELYAKHYCFEQAIHFYKQYLNAVADGKTQPERVHYVESQIAYTEKGARYLKRVTDLTIVDSITLPKEQFLEAYQLSHEMGTLTYTENGLIAYTNQRNDRRILTDTVGEQLALLSCQRLLDGWSACDTLHLDTRGNIHYPFMLSDGLTLYFASDDPEGLGGYDIYFTRYNAEQNTHLAPENLGFPFNSKANDYLLVLDENRHRGYFATDRFVADSLVTIYTFIPNAETRILRQVDSIYLRDAAQLKVWSQPAAKHYEQAQMEQNTSTDPSIVESEQSPAFIINDSIVCYTEDDFMSMDAVALFNEYIEKNDALQEAEEALAQARADYALAEEASKKELATVILTYEQTIPKLRKEVATLATNIRILELKQRRL